MTKINDLMIKIRNRGWTNSFRKLMDELSYEISKLENRKASNPLRYCTGCNFILMENEHNKDADDNEYCDDCKSKVENIAGDLDED